MRLPPFAKLLAYLICGIITSNYRVMDWRTPFLIALVGILVMVILHLNYYSFKKLWRVFYFQSGVFFVFFAFGIILSQQNISDNTFSNIPYNASFNGIIKVVSVEQDDSTRSIHGALENGVLNGRTLDKTIQIVFKENVKQTRLIYPDDQLFVSGKANSFFINTNPGSFNYGQFMMDKGFAFQSSVQTLEVLNRPTFSLNRIIYTIRNYLAGVLSRHMNRRELGVAQALVLGQKQFLEPETKVAFASAGAMHILAVSGLHVGLVFLLFNFLFKSLKKLPKGRFIHTTALVLVIVLYAAITGFSPSVTRASLMFILLSIGMTLNRVGDTYNTIFASAFLMLIFDPSLLFNVGFQLSYAAVIGIIYLYPKLFLLLSPSTFLGAKIWSLLCLAVSAQLATFPLGLYYFHQFPTYFLITNVVVIPAAFAVLFGGMVLFFFSSLNALISNPIEDFFGLLYNGLVWLLNEFVALLQFLPYNALTNIQVDFAQLILMYVTIIFFVATMVYKHRLLLRLCCIGSLALVSLFTWNGYQTHATSGILVYQSQVPAIEIFEGTKSRCYSGVVEEDKQVYFNRMIEDFNRLSGRNTEEIIFSQKLRKYGLNELQLMTGRSWLSLDSKQITFANKSIKNEQFLSLDSARTVVIRK